MPLDDSRLMGFPPRAEPAERPEAVKAFSSAIGWSSASAGGCMECAWSGPWRMFDASSSIDEAIHSIGHRLRIIGTHRFACAGCGMAAKHCARGIRRGDLKCCSNCEHDPNNQKKEATMALSVNHSDGSTSGRVEPERIDLLGMKVPPLTIVDKISFETIKHVTQNTSWTERVATVTLRVPLAD